MNTKLSCPVCDRPSIEENICPNCETDLSLVRMLVELPHTIQSQSSLSSNYWPPRIATLLLLIAAMALGGIGGYFLSQLQPVASLLPAKTIQPVEISKLPPIKSYRDGFNYNVRSGDSLSALAWRFYGNEANLFLILQANPQLTKREDSLKIGEKLLIPNLITLEKSVD